MCFVMLFWIVFREGGILGGYVDKGLLDFILRFSPSQSEQALFGLLA